MKKKHISLMSLIALWTMLISVSALAVPQYINYQGKLTDNLGNSLPDTTYDMQFYLCDAVSSGTCAWNETQTVYVTNGIYNVQLGDVVSFPAGLFNTDLYLEVLISDDGGVTWETLSPRQKVTTTAYAMKSQDAETLDGNLATDFAEASHLHDAADINSGILSTSRFSARNDLSAEGYLGNAAGDIAQNNATLQTDLNADLLDGLDSSSFTQTSQDYGRSGVAADLYEGATTLTTKYVNEGQAGSISSGMLVDGSTLAEILDDDGSGSGLDADLLDGYNSSNFSLATHWHSYLNAADGSPGSVLWLNNDGQVAINTLYSDAQFSLTTPDDRYAGLILNSGGYDAGPNYGLYVNTTGNATINSSGQAYGIYSSATNNFSSYGGYFRGVGEANYGTYGIRAEGRNDSSVGATFGGAFFSYAETGTAWGIDVRAITQDGLSTGTVYGIDIDVDHNGTSGIVYGSRSIVTGSNTGDIYGYYANAQKYTSDTGGQAYGGYFIADNDYLGGGSYGLYSEATGANGTRYGLYNKVITSGANSYSNYGVYSQVQNTNGGYVYGYYGNLDTSGSSPAWGGYIDIDTTATATGTLRGYYASVSHSGTSGTVYGAYTAVTGSDTGDAYGFLGYAYKSPSDTAGIAYGGYFTGTTSWTGGPSYGVYAKATGYNGTRYGVYSEVTNSAGPGYYNNYGFYAEVENDYGSAVGLSAVATHIGSSGLTYGVSGTVYSSSSSSGYAGIFNAHSETGDTGSIYGIYAHVDSYTTGSKYAGYFYKSGGGNYAGYFYGNVSISGSLSATSKSFIQPHKDDPTKEIVYVSIEGPEHRVVLNGKADLVDGEAFINMPEAWQQVAATEGITVTVTPMGGWAPLYVESVSVEELVVKSADIAYGDLEFSYHISAIRDGFQDHEAIQENTHFTANDMSAWQFEDQYGADTLDNEAIKGMLKKNGIMTADGKLNKGKATKLGWKVKDNERDPHYRKAHGLPELEGE